MKKVLLGTFSLIAIAGCFTMYLAQHPSFLRYLKVSPY